MTDAHSLLALAECCAAAEVGGIDLDRDIAAALSVKFGPLYTQSVEAALTLMPRGCALDIQGDVPAIVLCEAILRAHAALADERAAA